MFKNLKIGMKLNLGFGFILILLMGIGIAGYLGANSIANLTLKMIKTDANIAMHSARARANVLGLRRGEKDIFLNIGNQDKIHNYLKSWEEQHSRLVANIEDLQKVATSQQEQDMIKSMKNDLADYEAGFTKVYNLVETGSIKTPQEGNAAIDVYKASIHSMEKTSRDLATLGTNLMDSQESVVTKYSNRIAIIIIMLSIIAVVIGIVASIINTRGIVIPLHKATTFADLIAKRDLTCSDLPVIGKDEVASLSVSLNTMKQSLSDIIEKFSDTSNHVASSSEELSATVTQIIKRVDEQAAKANQVATASTEMSQTVIDIAKNSSNIASSSLDTLKTAQDGEHIVAKTVNEVQEIADTVDNLAKVMTSLGDRSKQIGEIISVIKDIADQTNLLALNAAIEAARAGKQGRGFAVVADEVRKLAEKTAHSTSEIGGMITAIQDETERAVVSMGEGTKKVKVGVQLANEAGAGLSKIVDSVNGLQSMVQQIASATEQMSTVSEQISGDIEVIASVSKETSAGSYQIGQESDNLSKIAVALKTDVSHFRVNGNGNGRHVD